MCGKGCRLFLAQVPRNEHISHRTSFCLHNSLILNCGPLKLAPLLGHLQDSDTKTPGPRARGSCLARRLQAREAGRGSSKKLRAAATPPYGCLPGIHHRRDRASCPQAQARGPQPAPKTSPHVLEPLKPANCGSALLVPSQDPLLVF